MYVHQIAIKNKKSLWKISNIVPKGHCTGGKLKNLNKKKCFYKPLNKLG